MQSFVWSDNKIGDILASMGTQQFIVRASGGVWFYSNGGKTAGAVLPSGSGSWSSVSSVDAKTDFAPVDELEILRSVERLDIRQWRYLEERSDVRHVGPVSEDFYKAFGLGHDDSHIATVDADGVALAAIQGLYELVQQQQAEIEALKARMAATEERAGK